MTLNSDVGCKLGWDVQWRNKMEKQNNEITKEKWKKTNRERETN
jgi:hypothetical protein